MTFKYPIQIYASTQWSEFEWGHGMQLKCPALSELPQHIVQFWKKKKKKKSPPWCCGHPFNFLSGTLERVRRSRDNMGDKGLVLDGRSCHTMFGDSRAALLCLILTLGKVLYKVTVQMALATMVLEARSLMVWSPPLTRDSGGTGNTLFFQITA